MHGGASLSGAAHGRYTHGNFTREAIARRKALNALLWQARQILGNINRGEAPRN